MHARDAGLIALFVAGWSAVPAGRTPGGDLPVRIRLHAVTASNVTTVENARGLVESVLRDVAVVPEWIDCDAPVPPPGCSLPPGPDEFVVRIVPALSGAPHACGASLQPHGPVRGHFITIFSECVQHGADHVRTTAPVVFAYALLHEMGHLLLPEGHARDGIMRSRPDRFDWIRASRGALRFTPAEAIRIRATLQAHMLLAEGRR